MENSLKIARNHLINSDLCGILSTSGIYGVPLVEGGEIMTLLQAVLIGCVAALTKIEGGWFGESKLREPIVPGFLGGLILGGGVEGLVFGAQLQLMWMGAVNIGPTAQLDIGTGGAIGAAAAIVSGAGIETAIMFGIPVSILMQFLASLLMTGYSGFMAKVEADIDHEKFGSISSLPRRNLRLYDVFRTYNRGNVLWKRCNQHHCQLLAGLGKQRPQSRISHASLRRFRTSFEYYHGKKFGPIFYPGFRPCSICRKRFEHDWNCFLCFCDCHDHFLDSFVGQQFRCNPCFKCR